MAREKSGLVELTKIRVVMKCENYNGMPLYILTAYLVE